MIVVAEQEIWRSTAGRDLDLAALVSACAGERHILVTKPRWVREDPSGPVNMWLLSLPQSLRKAVEATLDRGFEAWPGANKSGVARIDVVTHNANWSKGCVTVSMAVRLLWRPLKLLVENRRNDGAFLLRMAEPSDRRQLQRAIEKGWLELEMGGGLGEIRKRLEELHAVTSAQPSEERDARMVELARLWVMYDRDADALDRSRESSASGVVRQLAARITVPWELKAHQLERRSIESYVPSTTLARWWCEQAQSKPKQDRRKKKVNALLKLSPKARYHFNMKGGLLGDSGLNYTERKRARAGERTLEDSDTDPLFRTLGRDEKAALADGFRDVAEAFSSKGAIEEDAFARWVPSEERRRILQSLLSRL